MNQKLGRFLTLVILLSVRPALAQVGIRGWYANGQIWLVWRDDQTFTGAETYDVYTSSFAIDDLRDRGVALAGRLLPSDFKAVRLRRANADLTWTIPDAKGGLYRLGADEAHFAYTPHGVGARVFAVVKSGKTTLTVANRTGLIETPAALDAVEAYPQLQGTDGIHPSTLGQTFTDYAFFLDGAADAEGGRVDFPVMGNAAYNGTASLFRVYDPPAPAPVGKLPCVILMHAEGGSWTGTTTEIGGDGRRLLADGLVVSLDDHHFVYDATGVSGTKGVVSSDTRWFGYWKDFDRFSTAERTPVPNGSIVVPYSLRRTGWVVDWLVAKRNADPARVALMGYSMGGGGVSLTVRYSPERFAAAVAFEGPTSVTSNELSGSYMLGSQAQNLPTSLAGFPGVGDLYRPTTAIGKGDLPPITFVWGVNDSVVVWRGRPETIQALDQTRRGHVLDWDERGHGTLDWSGRWVGSPRHTAGYLLRLRADQSFPAFSNDTNPQGDPFVAVPTSVNTRNYGTRGGYFEWDPATVSDTPLRWGSTVYLRSASSFANDVSPFDTITADVTVRRALLFKPAAGTKLDYTLRRQSDGGLLKSGELTVGADGLVALDALPISKEPARLEVVKQGIPTSTWILPSSARIAGSGGSFYTTGLTLANTGAADASVLIKLLGNGVDGRSGPERALRLAAGKSVTYDDVLGTLFGQESAFGALRIVADTPSLAIVSQTSTPGASGGTFGQSVPAFSTLDLVTVGAPRSIAAIREDGAFRTNLVLANAVEASLTVDVALVSETGAVLGSKSYAVPPLGMVQVSRVVVDLGVGNALSGARLALSTSTAGGSFAAYATVIDNSTNDPRTLLPKGAGSGSFVVIPSAARAGGQGGAFYTTDVTVANFGTEDATFTLKFLGNNVDGGSGVERSLSLGAAKSVTYRDVLQSVFGLDSGFGAILVGATSVRLLVTTQTSTPAASGTFGQSVPGHVAEDLIGLESRSIVGVREDDSFRTNLVLVSNKTSATVVDVALVAESGAELGRKAYTLPPLAMTQVSKVVRDLGVQGLVTGGRLVLSAATAEAAFVAYASVIDNVTNDPRTLLAR